MVSGVHNLPTATACASSLQTHSAPVLTRSVSLAELWHVRHVGRGGGGVRYWLHPLPRRQWQDQQADRHVHQPDDGPFPPHGQGAPRLGCSVCCVECAAAASSCGLGCVDSCFAARLQHLHRTGAAALLCADLAIKCFFWMSTMHHAVIVRMSHSMQTCDRSVVWQHAGSPQNLQYRVRWHGIATNQSVLGHDGLFAISCDFTTPGMKSWRSSVTFNAFAQCCLLSVHRAAH